MRQNIALANSGEYEPYIFIADYHSMTSLTDRDARLKSSFDLACAYLACGLDTSKVTLFKQSDVPEHAELAWMLATVAPFSSLMLAHSFKDKVTRNNSENIDDIAIEDKVKLQITNEVQFEQYGEIKQMSAEELEEILPEVSRRFNALTEAKLKYKKFCVSALFDEIKYKNINAGLFTYPVLMAADILMYNANVVPVGKDQIQHIEMTREIAGKFNRAYDTDFFTMPKEYVMQDVAIVPGTDGAKMSKSYGNVIPLFGTDEEIKKTVMGIVTDSARPEDKKNSDENNIYNIHKLFLTKEENEVLRRKFEDGGYGYKDAKEACADAVIKFIAPYREKYDYYQSHPEVVNAILEEGKKKAQAKAAETMLTVKKLVGLTQ
jgi:tryptophanyl-tRNA synthetase